ncbi:PatA/PatG family cyanobactin maturation protease [Shewanella surugensis]|uniref:PatA/PatG family cyanobactin maturation protease n=1 Tax=Shewanella surugensis TaxID=212020 RepID=A0ABT0LI00_9GAMM|nr:PatA/PatG family cyanobactin maturation protease [Shewanella surugensis]MCL1127323.1 PatA/PatG family cyanobactin maturation protease [Shewanella surugensis]
MVNNTTHIDITVKINGLAKLWEHTKGEPEICIAILDGSVDMKHNCFIDSNTQYVNTLHSDTSKEKPSQHGTHIASLLFGNHNSPVKGIAPRCRGIFLPIYSYSKVGELVSCSQVDLARAIIEAINSGANIINISGGQLSSTGKADPMLLNAVKSCEENNVLLIAAAGNDSCNCLHIPAAIPSTLAIGAMDDMNKPLSNSNWGESYLDNGILAPGHKIFGAFPKNLYGELSGTSFATAIVSGIAALMLSLQVKNGLMPDPCSIRKTIISTATACKQISKEIVDCRRYLAGIINIDLIKKNILNGGKTTMSEYTNEVDEVKIRDENSVGDALLSPNSTETLSIQNNSGICTSGEVKEDMQAIKQISKWSNKQREIAPSGCSCEGSSNETSLVYALGKIDFDFGTEARRDSFSQSMPVGKNTPHSPEDMLTYLDDNPFEAQSIIWTLNLDVTPIYAIQPIGAFANVVYERLREALKDQVYNGVELISIPGLIAGSTTLYNGQTVPLIVPNPRGMYSWATHALVEDVLGKRPAKSGDDQNLYDAHRVGLNNFLERVYYDLRNLGVSPEDRALNYSATNAFQVSQVIESTTKGKLELDHINVNKSPISRPDSDCYDVELSFFNPNNLQNANKIYRFTIDVSDEIPVTIGEVRSWSKR